MQFKDFIQNEKILQTLDSLGFQSPTAIQAQAIPELMKGSDLRATSETGSGKTAAFLLPALMRLSQTKGKRWPRVMILAPTRELAMQIATEASRLGRSLGVVIVSLYGGVPYHQQYRQLSKPHDILIATPGRLIDHLEQNRLQLSDVEMFVLDEADRMLDMGFIGPVEEIAAKMPANRQTVMFSATFGKGVRRLSATLLRNPFEISVGSTEKKHENIEQSFLRTHSLEDKLFQLDQVLAQPNLDQAIVFSSTKMQTERLAETLKDRGLHVAALHGDMRQQARTRTIQQFRMGKVKILVATDVAARGIDVLTVSHVINFDVPSTLDDYIHRIGRTGRAGGKGFAISFFSHKDQQIRREIERFSGMKIQTDAGSPASPRKERFSPQRPYQRHSQRPAKRADEPDHFGKKRFAFAKKRGFKSSRPAK